MKRNPGTVVERWSLAFASRMRREEGIAMIVTLLVLMVVTSLMVAVLQLSIHNVNQSAYDRRRDQAVQAAEGGLNAYMASLPTATGTAICSPVSGTMGGTTNATYSISITIYDSAGAVLPCSGTSDPARALVKSTGTSGIAGQDVSRTIETLIDLRAIYVGLDKAIFSDLYLTISNRLTVEGNIGNDGNIYTNGNLSMSNYDTINGNVYAQGSATITNSSAVYADIWANGAVTMNSSPVVFGNVTSSTSSVQLDNSTHVSKNVTAGTTITVQNNSSVDGVRTQYAPQGPPPAIPLPRLYWNAAVQTAWQNAGYTVQSFSDCTAAKTFIGGISSGDYVIRITPACALTWANHTDVNLHGNLAIVTDGSISAENQVNFNAVGGTWKMYWIVPYPNAGSPNCSTWGGISASNQTTLNGVQQFAYTPCTLNYANNNTGGWDGQLIGGVVNITNQMDMHYQPIAVPSYARTGYNAQPNYIREVQSGS